MSTILGIIICDLDPGKVNRYLVGVFLVRHCVLITAAGAKARVIISKGL